MNGGDRGNVNLFGVVMAYLGSFRWGYSARTNGGSCRRGGGKGEKFEGDMKHQEKAKK